MKTKISLLTGLITALLFAAALSSEANDSKKQRNKAHKQMGQGQSQSSNPTPTPTPSWLYLDLPKGQKQKDQASAPKPVGKSSTSTQWTKTEGDAQERFSVGSDGTQAAPTPTPDPLAKKSILLPYFEVDGPSKKGSQFEIDSKSSASANQKKGEKPVENKKRHHDDANNTYDGSPILYNKPKPTSDTEDWHKKNRKNKQKHHDDDQNQGND